VKLSGIMLNYQNPKKLADFYTKILGMPGWKQGEIYGYESNGNNIFILQNNEVKGKNSMPVRIMLSFAVDDVDKEFKMVNGTGDKVAARAVPARQRKQPQGAASHLSRFGWQLHTALYSFGVVKII
jgi:catechol 2,3-dioxygenase-like lactoylglutathione lyase family enzyme